MLLRYFNAAGADPDGEIGEWHEPETHLIPNAINAVLDARAPLDIYGDDYATPVVYPLSQIPHKYRTLMNLNPMTAVVESFRYAFMGSGTVSLRYIAVSWAVTLAVLVVGVLLFSKVEKTFMDTVQQGKSQISNLKSQQRTLNSQPLDKLGASLSTINHQPLESTRDVHVARE